MSSVEVHVPPPAPSRLPALDALRAMGAAAVVGTHVGFATGATFTSAVGRHGWPGWTWAWPCSSSSPDSCCSARTRTRSGHGRASVPPPAATCGGGPAHPARLLADRGGLPAVLPAATRRCRPRTGCAPHAHPDLRARPSARRRSGIPGAWPPRSPSICCCRSWRARSCGRRWRPGRHDRGAVRRRRRDHRRLARGDGRRMARHGTAHDVAARRTRPGSAPGWRWPPCTSRCAPATPAALARAGRPGGRAPLACWALARWACSPSRPPRSPARGTWPSRPPAQFGARMVLLLGWSSRCCCRAASRSVRRPVPSGAVAARSRRWLGLVSYGLFLWHPFVLDVI